MTFFQHQDRARQNTQKLVGLYLLAIVCIIISIYFALLFTSWGIAAKTARRQIETYSSPAIEQPINGSNPDSDPSRGVIKFRDPNTGQMVEVPVIKRDKSQLKKPKLAWNAQSTSWWQPQLFLLATIPTILVIGGASLLKLHALRQGGALVAQELGGRLVLPEMAVTEQEKQLINVVEEMAIAANILPPMVYILDSEGGINAFAAGSNPKNAVIGVTRGCLEQLNRDELQGVIGHEFSHILNGDMKLNMQLIGALHGILFIYLFGRLLTYVRSRDSNYIMYLGFGLMAIGGLGHFFGRLIQSAVSRQREFLADASAVQFTRNPEGIASALSKIEGNTYRSYVDSPYAEEMSHLFFGTALNSNWFADWFATHPPIRHRIQKVESYWQRNGSRLSAVPSPLRSRSQNVGDQPSSMAMGFAGGNSMAGATVESSREASQFSSSSTPAIPNWLSQIPESLQSIQDERSAVALVYALLLETQNPTARTVQENGLRKVEPSVVDLVLQIAPAVEALEPRFRFPLIEFVMPILRQSSAERCQHILKTVQALAKADGRWSLFEFALYTVLRERLQPGLMAETSQTETPAPEQMWADSLLVISAIAQAGANKPEVAAYAFRAGADQLAEAKQRTIPNDPIKFQIGELKQSLDRLKRADSKTKQNVMSACSYMVMLDNTVSQAETELMWAIAITLNCPLPPFLNISKVGAKGTRRPVAAKP